MVPPTASCRVKPSPVSPLFLRFCLAALLAVARPLPADVLTWDGATGSAGLQDGGGQWNITDANRWFNTSAGPPAYQIWNNAPADSAIFGNGTAGTYSVTLAVPITVEDITFQTAGYTISSVANQFTLAAGSVVTTNAAATLDVSLAGTNGFTKEGTAGLTLSGATANVMGGTTVINNGTLTMAKSAGVDSIAGNVTINGGTLAWGANSNQLANTASITVSGGQVNFNNRDETFASYTQTSGLGIPNSANAGIVTLTGTLAISGGSGMTINSSGQWSAQTVNFTGLPAGTVSVLMGGNGPSRVTSLTVGSGGLTMSGQTITMNRATMTNAHGNRLTLNGTFTGSGTNVIQMDAAPTIAGSINEINLGTTNRVFDITAGTTTISGTFTVVGAAGLTKTGAGTLAFNVLGGANAINVGDIMVQGGTLTLSQNNQLADATNIAVAGGVVTFGGTTETFASFTQTSALAAGSSTGTNGSLTITGTLKIASGTGTGIGFTINSGAQVSAATVDLRGSNYTGGTTNYSLLMGGNTAALFTQLTVGPGGLLLDGQIIQMNAGPKGNRIVLNGNVSASGTNTLRMDAGPTAGALHEIDLGGVTRVFDITAGTTSINNAIVVMNGGLTKTGAGALTLTGTAANTYTGLTTVTGGTLNMTKTGGVTSIAGDILVNGGALVWGTSNADQVADTASLTISSGTINFNNRNETLANLTKTDGEQGANGGAITVTGTLLVSGGTSNGGATNGWTINSNGVTTANTVDFRGFVGPGGNVALLIGGNGAIISTLSVGSGGLFLNGQTLMLNPGTNASTMGSQIVLGGNVTASGTNSFSVNTGTPDPNSVTRIDMGSGIRTWNITSGTTTVAASMGLIGSASIVKDGAGTLQFSGVTAYNGKTTVAAGTLTLAAAGRIDASPWIQIDGGATLNVSAIAGGYAYANSASGIISGSGAIQGSMVLNAEKTIKPGGTSDPSSIATAGDGTGTLTVNGNLTINPPASPIAPVAEFTIQSGTTADKLVINGNFTLNDKSNIRVLFDPNSPFTPSFGQTWMLIDWTGILTAGGFNVGQNLRTGTNSQGNEGNLDLPELSGENLWRIENTFAGTGSLTITVVPEPGRGMLVVGALAAMALRRRRHGVPGFTAS